MISVCQKWETNRARGKINSLNDYCTGVCQKWGTNRARGKINSLNDYCLSEVGDWQSISLPCTTACVRVKNTSLTVHAKYVCSLAMGAMTCQRLTIPPY